MRYYISNSIKIYFRNFFKNCENKMDKEAMQAYNLPCM